MVIGVEFDRAKIVAALVDETGRVAAERRAETPARTTRAVATAMAGLVLELAASPERGASLIHAIGFAADGVVDPPTSRVTIAGLKGWTRVALRPMVEQALADSGHDVRTPANQFRARAEVKDSPHPTIAIHSRAAALAAAEAWTGAARGKRNVVYLSLGESISAGILADGRALRGSSGHAGAAGWLATGREFKSEYESRGALTVEAGGQALARHAIEGWSGIADSLLGGLVKTDPSAIDAAMVLRAAKGGDDLAAKALAETCGWIGRGIANLISILNPDAVVLGGELGTMLKPHLDEIRDEVYLWTSPDAARACRIVSASLGEKAAVIGAAKLASPVA